MNRQKIVLTYDISAGTGDASDEFELLKSVFVDTGFSEQIKNIDNPKCIVLGPTGAGKTALIGHLVNDTDNLLQIHPDDLSISYIHRSTIIQDMERCGVNLAPVFRFVWQHVFLIELIRMKFDLNTENSISRWVDKLKSQYLPGSTQYRAVQYMEKWNHNIWESVDKRVRQITQSLEDSVKAGVSTKVPSVMSGTLEYSDTERKELKEQYESAVQSFISQKLIQEQKEILEICVSDFFNNRAKPYYIVIDDLDKDWAPDELKGLMLKSLLMAIKHLKRIPNVKIIIALREDIKHQLFHEIATPGFQEDKFESLELRLKWTPEHLRRIADARINHSFRSKYTNARVSVDQIFAQFQIDKMSPFEYLLSRTRYRPRELILFINACIDRAVGDRSGQISRTILMTAEKVYSGKRIQAVYDEWGQIYPCIKIYIDLLRKKPANYSVGRFLSLDSTELRNEIALHDDWPKDPIGRKICTNTGEGISDRKLFREIVKVLYRCGIIGMKLYAELPTVWAFLDDAVLEDSSFDTKTKMNIHAAFFKALGIDTRQNTKLGVTAM